MKPSAILADARACSATQSRFTGAFKGIPSCQRLDHTPKYPVITPGARLRPQFV